MTVTMIHDGDDIKGNNLMCIFESRVSMAPLSGSTAIPQQHDSASPIASQQNGPTNQKGKTLQEPFSLNVVPYLASAYHFVGNGG